MPTPIVALAAAEHADSPFAFLADVNAGLNALATVLIVAGLVAIKTRRETAHKVLMLVAALVSAMFLASYLVYHFNVGSVEFEKTGSIRTVYFVILITHVVLAAVQVPLILRTIWLGIRIDRVESKWGGERREDALRHKHRRIAKITAPIWLYVSITGVVVYWMLYRL